MRAIIFADMEGTCGIQSWEHTGGTNPLYDEGRRLYTEEINAMVRGCKRAGAEEIVAVDGHGGSYDGAKPFMSWIPDRLEGGAQYVVGYPYGRYVQPLRDGFDCALFIGAHAMAGTPAGVLCHTISGTGWYKAEINGRAVSETTMLSAIAGTFGVSVALVAGDAALCEDALSVLGPGLVTAAVKHGLGRYASRNLAPADARALIEERTYQALSHQDAWPKPLTLETPVVFRVELASPDLVAGYASRVGVEVAGPRTVQVTANTFAEAWDRFWVRA